jgi:hypothetical protein
LSVPLAYLFNVERNIVMHYCILILCLSKQEDEKRTGQKRYPDWERICFLAIVD